MEANGLNALSKYRPEVQTSISPFGTKERFAQKASHFGRVDEDCRREVWAEVITPGDKWCECELKMGTVRSGSAVLSMIFSFIGGGGLHRTAGFS